VARRGEQDLEDTLTTTLAIELRRRSSEGTRYTLPTLRVVAGPDMLRFCSVYPDEEVVIGRDDACELTLHDGSVSRRHAAVRSDAGGRLTLRDMGSTNGTTCNGRLVPPEGVALLPGDHLDVGGEGRGERHGDDARAWRHLGGQKAGHLDGHGPGRGHARSATGVGDGNDRATLDLVYRCAWHYGPAGVAHLDDHRTRLGRWCRLCGKSEREENG